MDEDDAIIAGEKLQPSMDALSAKEVQVLQNPKTISDFVAESDSKQSQFQESTLPACVFRKHLELSKHEHEALHQLYDDIELGTSHPHARPNNGLDVSELCDEDIPDSGSKTNLLLYGANPKEVSWTPSSPSDFDLSQRIFLKDVLANPMNSYSDKFILGKNLAVPVLSRLNGSYILNTVIGDETTSKVVRLKVTCNVKDAEKIFLKLKHAYLHNLEPDSIIMVRNPSFGTDVAEQSLSIRIEEMKDVCFFSSQHFQSSIFKEEAFKNVSATSSIVSEAADKSEASLWLSPTPEAKCASNEWKCWGNQYSLARLHTQALFCYNIAIRLDADNVEAHASRVSSLINLGFYSAARDDVEIITTHDPSNTGFILRKVNCLWGLGKYDEAIEYLKQVLELLPALLMDKEEDASDIVDFSRKEIFIQRIIVKTEKMKQQQNDISQVDPVSFFKNSNRIVFDEPEYYKPIDIVEQTQPCSSSPKMVIANRKVHSGELLVITKAFSVIFLDSTSKILVELVDELAELTMQRLKLDKPSEESFYKLDAVLNSRERKDSNVCHDSAAGKMFDCFSIDAVKKLCNAHFYSGNVFMQSSEGSGLHLNKNMGGLWTFPTHVRHVCVGGNAIWYTCGNLMFIRAVRDIEAGEEITMAHIEPTELLESRQAFINIRGITCSCALCRFELTEPHQVKAKRLNIMNEMRLNGLFPSNEWSNELNGPELRKFKRCVDNLTAIRSAFPKLNFPIVDPLHVYGINMMNAANFDEAIDSFEKAYFVVDDTTAIFNLINLSLHLSYCYTMKKKNRDRIKAKKWFNATVQYAMLAYGCLEPVKINFKSIYEHLEGKGVAALK